MKMVSVQQASFDRLVSNGFERAASDDVKAVALAVWHENFVPMVDHLSNESALAAGYVVDKLMRFSCVPVELKKKLAMLLGELREKFVVVPVVKKGCDTLAQQWGLSEDLKHQIRSLLDYQTRHYRHA